MAGYFTDLQFHDGCKFLAINHFDIFAAAAHEHSNIELVNVFFITVMISCYTYG